ncbi:MAG: ATP-binding cassette domain-containing protein, partial [Nitrospirota bacterium]
MIEVIDVYKSFGNKNVLDGVNLKIGESESMVVIGGSGSGKSVLIKNIIGLMRPDSGSILVDGTDITRITDERELNDFRKRFGMLFQYAALFDSMKVWENVSFALMRVYKM